MCVYICAFVNILTQVKMDCVFKTNRIEVEKHKLNPIKYLTLLSKPTSQELLASLGHPSSTKCSGLRV